MECGSKLPLSEPEACFRLLEPPQAGASKAGANLRTPYRRDFDATLHWEGESTCVVLQIVQD